MKIKLLSMLIAMCMVIGMVPAVSADGIADYPILEYEKELQISCSGMDYSYATFTPVTSGAYRFYSVGEEDTYARLFDAQMNLLAGNDDCYDEGHGHEGGINFCIVYELEAGVTYVLGVRNYSGSTGEMTVAVAHVHNFTYEVIKEATCSERGLERGTCTLCGYIFETSIWELPCDYTSVVTMEPTCTQNGMLTHTCTVCGNSYTETIHYLDHAYNGDLICTRCGITHPTSGTWTDESGKSVDWVFSDGLLILTGEGRMPERECEYDYNWNVISWYSSPWSNLPITEVVIGRGITDISSAAFLGAAKLEKVTLPDTITYISEKAFADCTALTAVELPESLERMGSSVFAGSALREIHLPASFAQTWGVSSAFYKAAMLERITVAEDNPVLTADSQGAVYTKDMTELLHLPDGFRGTFVIPAVVETMATGMYVDCTNLEAIVVEEGNGHYYSRDGILYSTYYDSIYDPETDSWEDVYLGERMLCCPPAKELGSYRIEDWVIAVNRSAFGNCRFLTELTIPAGCIYVDASSLAGECPALEALWFEEGHPIYFTGDDGLVYNGEKYHEYNSGYFSEDELKSFGVGGLLCWVPSGRTGILNIREGVKAMDTGAISNTKLSAIRFPSTFTSFFVYAVNGEENNIEWVLFTGEKPDLWSYDAGEDCTLHNVNATVYYPGWLESWSDPELQQCGAEKLTYVSYEQGKEPVWGEEEPENPFTDVPAGSFYEEPVLWAVEKGITTGAGADSFDPNGQCLRAHVVTFLWRAEGCPEPESLNNPFVDVKESDFYFKAVLWAVEKNITNGSDATHFNPFGVCNRAQVVTFLHRAKGSPAPASMDLPFTDVLASSWYAAPVAWAVEKGITNGLSATQFGPDSACNRAQVVTFLYRTLK